MMGRKTSITVRIPIDLLDRLDAYGAVSYTHLTLPTILLV